MHIAALCPTYKRPLLLGRAIHCFLEQTHPECELIVLDDAGQYESRDYGRWRMVSTTKRYDCLAVKRQVLSEMVSPGIEGILCWDDDDVYFPHAIAAVSECLENHAWAQCRLVYETEGENRLAVTPAFRRNRITGRLSWGYGGCWAYRLQEFRAVGGYDPTPSSNDDVILANTFYARYDESGDSTSAGFPWYWYCRDPGVVKVSDQGNAFWAMRAGWPSEQMGCPPIGWNGPDIYRYRVVPGVQNRPF